MVNEFVYVSSVLSDQSWFLHHTTSHSKVAINFFDFVRDSKCRFSEQRIHKQRIVTLFLSEGVTSIYKIKRALIKLVK